MSKWLGLTCELGKMAGDYDRRIISAPYVDCSDPNSACHFFDEILLTGTGMHRVNSGQTGRHLLAMGFDRHVG